MMRRVALMILLWCTVLMTAGCQLESDSDAHKRGVQEGLAQGREEGTKEGYEKGHQEGYAEGFAALHPPGDFAASSIVIDGLKIGAAIGGIKILVGIMIAIVKLFNKNRNEAEQIAKFICVFLGATIAFFASRLWAVDSELISFFLLPTSGSILLTIWVTASAITTYILIALAGRLLEAMDGPKIEALCIIFLGGLGTILGDVLFQMAFGLPNIAGYAVYFILSGVVIGGLSYLVVWLLEEEKREAEAERRRARATAISGRT